MCVRVATEALGRVDLLGGLVAVSIDEVKYKKGALERSIRIKYVEAKWFNIF